MKIEQWARSNPKMTIWIIGAIGGLLLMLLVNQFSSQVQDNQTVVTAVAQERINELERKIDAKTVQLAESRKSEDSLWVLVKEQEQKINKYKVKYAEISSKYDKERSKTKELTNVESVGLFLDNTEQSEFPIIQYEDSTQYVIPIHSIEYANVMAVDLDEQIAVNTELKGESNVKTIQIKSLHGIIDNKEEQIVVLTEVNKYTNDIILEKDKQLVAEHKKYRQQKVKTYVTGIIGGIIVVCSLIF